MTMITYVVSVQPPVQKHTVLTLSKSKIPNVAIPVYYTHIESTDLTTWLRALKIYMTESMKFNKRFVLLIESSKELRDW